MSTAAPVGQPVPVGAGGSGGRGSGSGSGSGSQSDSDRKRRGRHGRRGEKRRHANAKVDRHRSRVLERVARGGQRETKRQRTVEGFVCPIVYRNELPDPPLAPKYVEYPFDSDRLFKYNPKGSTLEARYKFGINAQIEAGVPINIIDPAGYRAPPPDKVPPLDPKDEELLDEAYAFPADAERVMEPHEVQIRHTWMFSGDYMDNDLSRTYYTHKNALDGDRARVLERHKAAQEAELAKPKLQRILEGFEKTSDDALFEHSSNKKLYPKTMWSLLPDPERYSNKFVQVDFDVNPDDAQERKLANKPPLDPELRQMRLANALIRTVDAGDDDGDGHIGTLLLPDTQKQHEDDGAMRLRRVRDYKLYAIPAADQDSPTYAFMWDDDQAAVYYSKVVARVELKKQLVGAEGKAHDVLLRQREPTRAEELELELARTEIDAEDPDAATRKIQAELDKLEDAADDGSSVGDADGDVGVGVSSQVNSDAGNENSAGDDGDGDDEQQSGGDSGAEDGDSPVQDGGAVNDDDDDDDGGDDDDDDEA